MRISFPFLTLAHYKEEPSRSLGEHFTDFSLGYIQIGTRYCRQFDCDLLANASQFYSLYRKYAGKKEVFCSLCKFLHCASWLCLPEFFSPHVVSCLLAIVEGKHSLSGYCDWIGFVSLAGYLMVDEKIIGVNIDRVFFLSPQKRTSYRHITLVYKLYHSGYIFTARRLCSQSIIRYSLLQVCTSPSKFYRKIHGYIRQLKTYCVIYNYKLTFFTAWKITNLKDISHRQGKIAA